MLIKAVCFSCPATRYRSTRKQAGHVTSRDTLTNRTPLQTCFPRLVRLFSLLFLCIFLPGSFCKGKVHFQQQNSCKILASKTDQNQTHATHFSLSIFLRVSFLITSRTKLDCLSSCRKKTKTKRNIVHFGSACKYNCC